MVEVNVGDIAPDFELEDQDGKKVRLSEFRGKKKCSPGILPDGLQPCVHE